VRTIYTDINPIVGRAHAHNKLGGGVSGGKCGGGGKCFDGASAGAEGWCTGGAQVLLNYTRTPNVPISPPPAPPLPVCADLSQHTRTRDITHSPTQPVQTHTHI